MALAPLPDSAIGAPSPTSRSVFRLVVRAVGATNREADALRHTLLTRWAEPGAEGHDVAHLEDVLHALDATDPDGGLGAEVRLAAWFGFGGDDAGHDADPGARLAIAWAQDSGASADVMAEVARLVRAAASPENAGHDDPAVAALVEALLVASERAADR